MRHSDVGSEYKAVMDYVHFGLSLSQLLIVAILATLSWVHKLWRDYIITCVLYTNVCVCVYIMCK